MEKVRIFSNISPVKSRDKLFLPSFLGIVHYKHSLISVIFLISLLGKLIHSVDPQGNMPSHQGLQEQRKYLWKYVLVHVPLEYRYSRRGSKLKLDIFEITLILLYLPSYVIVVHIIAIFLFFGVLTITNK